MILHNFVLLKTNWLAAPIFLAGWCPVLPGTGKFPAQCRAVPHGRGSSHSRFLQAPVHWGLPSNAWTYRSQTKHARLGRARRYYCSLLFEVYSVGTCLVGWNSVLQEEPPRYLLLISHFWASLWSISKQRNLSLACTIDITIHRSNREEQFN